MKVDAIVNAANPPLLGGGVDGASTGLPRPTFSPNAENWGCPPGEVRLTRGYRLPASHVIHTVGPMWKGGAAGEQRILESCYRSCVGIARSQGFRDIAFPAIATGIYGFPREEAAKVAIATVGSDLAGHRLPELVIFVCFDAATLDAYRVAIGREG
jgi:O-acetyl-ADP-ribose deacetylase